MTGIVLESGESRERKHRRRRSGASAVIVLVALAMLGRAAPASAAELVPSACPPAVQTGIRSALAAIDIKCRVHRTEVEADGVPAGTIDQVKAEVVLADGRPATVEVTPQGASYASCRWRTARRGCNFCNSRWTATVST